MKLGDFGMDWGGLRKIRVFWMELRWEEKKRGKEGKRKGRERGEMEKKGKGRG